MTSNTALKATQANYNNQKMVTTNCAHLKWNFKSNTKILLLKKI